MMATGGMPVKKIAQTVAGFSGRQGRNGCGVLCQVLEKALAAMPEEDWMDRIPEHPIKYTPNTLTDREEIIDELRSIKRRGFAIDNMEHHTNIRCVGVPVYNGAGQLVAGISTSGPCDVMTDEKLMECAGILKNIALQMKERIYH